MATAKKKDEDAVIIRFRFDDDGRKIYSLDLADLTTREQIEIEEFFDKPLAVAYESGWLLESRKGMALLAYIARRRKEPEFTYEDAVSALKGMVDEEEESPPTKASKTTGSPT